MTTLFNIKDFCYNKNNKLEENNNLVTKIIINNQNLIKIPEGLDLFKNLEELNLNSNQISIIENLDKLKKLKNLYLNENKIKNIPINIFKDLIRLEELDLSINEISIIENLNKLLNLKILSLSKNKIEKIQNLKNFKKLKKLHLRDNRIIKIENIENLISLSYLDISNNEISKIEGINNLIKLESLFLHNNKIENLDNNLNNLENLRFLNLMNNKIGTLSKIPNLFNLDTLNLRNNKITIIDELIFFKIRTIIEEDSKLLNQGIDIIKNIQLLQIKNSENYLSNEEKFKILESFIIKKERKIKQSINIYIEKNPLKYSKIKLIENTSCNVFMNQNLECLYQNYIDFENKKILKKENIIIPLKEKEEEISFY